VAAYRCGECGGVATPPHLLQCRKGHVYCTACKETLQTKKIKTWKLAYTSLLIIVLKKLFVINSLNCRQRKKWSSVELVSRLL
jgi:hypothetical protein